MWLLYQRWQSSFLWSYCDNDLNTDNFPWFILQSGCEIDQQNVVMTNTYSCDIISSISTDQFHSPKNRLIVGNHSWHCWTNFATVGNSAINPLRSRNAPLACCCMVLFWGYWPASARVLTCSNAWALSASSSSGLSEIAVCSCSDGSSVIPFRSQICTFSPPGPSLPSPLWKVGKIGKRKKVFDDNGELLIVLEI